MPAVPAEHRPLLGCRVLVTRPRQQAGPVSARLRAAGAQVLAFPVLAIAAPRRPASARAALRGAGASDLAVFVSANAVAGAADLLGGGLGDLGAVHVAAVGAATARALGRHAVGPVIAPRGRFDSEALLALEALGEPAVRGRRVLIVKGEGGREALADALRARGARVEAVEVYRRVRAREDPRPVRAALARGDLDCALVTSVAGMESLFAAIGARAGEALRRLAFLVPSERVAGALAGAGVEGPVVVADRADDDAFARALEDWWTTSGAGARCAKRSRS